MSKALTGMVLALAFWVGCSTERPVDPRVERVWKHHEQVFAKAVAGSWDEDQFLEACTFFEELTGVRLHLEFSTLGALPTRQSKDDLAHLRRWYRDNRHRLYWDESTNRIKRRSFLGLG